MNEDTIRRIQQLIQQLTQIKGTLTSTSSDAAKLTRAVDLLSNAMKSGSTESARFIGYLEKFEAIANRVAGKQFDFSKVPYAGQQVTQPTPTSTVASTATTKEAELAAKKLKAKQEQLAEEQRIASLKQQERISEESRAKELAKLKNYITQRYAEEEKDFKARQRIAQEENRLREQTRQAELTALQNSIQDRYRLSDVGGSAMGEYETGQAKWASQEQTRVDRARVESLKEQEKQEKLRAKQVQEQARIESATYKEQQRLTRLGENALRDYEMSMARWAKQEQTRLAKGAPAYNETDLQRTYGQRYQNVARTAGQVNPGFNAQTLKSVENLGTSGYSRFLYQFKDAEGVLQKLPLVVDKFGSVIVDTQKRFRSFGDAVARDIGEFLKWSIAVGVVLGPLQKLSELTEIMIDNESKLADITVSLADAQRDSNDVFMAASDIAQATGEGLNGVIEAYNIAYRATGGINDETERFTVTNKLLTDAITLSSLSTLDQAEAIDTLSASLKQTGRELDQGTELLDKWTVLSRTVSVDLETLAVGFATIGGSAQAAGMTLEETNALIGIIAESSEMSAKEAANFAKVAILNFDTDTARKKFRELGISIEDTAGNIRNASDLYLELNQRLQAGSITSNQLSELTEAIAGGPRSGSKLLNAIQAMGKYQEAVDVQLGPNVAGASASALTIKLQTVEKSVTKLGNAFQGFAQTLGEKGGLLDSFRVILDITSKLVTVISDLTGALGKAGPVLLATAAAMAVFMRNGSQRLAASTGIGNMIGGVTGAVGGLFGTYRGEQARIAGSNFGLRYGQNMLGATPGILSAIQNAQAEDWGAVGADIAGAILGGLTGNPLLGAVGAGIAEAFYTEVFAKKGDWETFFSGTVPTPEPETDKVSAETLKTQAGKVLEESLSKTMADKIAIWLQRGINAIKGQPLTYEQTLLGLLPRALERGGVSQQQYDEIIKAFQDAVGKVQEEQGSQSTAAIARQGAVATEFGGMIAEVQKQMEMQLLDQINKREIGRGPYIQGKEALGGFSSLATSYYSAFGGELEKGLGTGTRGTFEALGLLTTKKPEEMEYLTSMVGELDALTNALENLNQADAEYGKTLELLNQKKQDAVMYTKLLYEEVLKQIEAEKEAKQESVGFQTIDASQAQLNQIMNGPYQNLLSQLTPLGYKEDTEQTIAITNDKVIVPMQKDMKIIQYLLGQIEKNTEKLDGVFNLPSGASFFVPQQVLEYYKAQSAPETSLGNLNTTVATDAQPLKVEPVDPYENMMPGEELGPGGLQSLINELKNPTTSASGGMLPDRALRQDNLDTEGLRQLGQDAILQQRIDSMGLGAVPGGLGVDMYGMVGGIGEKITFAILEAFRSNPYQDRMERGQQNLKDMKIGYGDEHSATWLSKIQGHFDKLFGGLPSTSRPEFEKPNLANKYPETTSADLNQFSPKNLTTNLNVTVESKSTILLDGRVLANQLKRYMARDLVRYSNNSHTTRITAV